MIAKKVRDKPANKTNFVALVKYLSNDQGKQNRLGGYWITNLNEKQDLNLAMIEVTATQSLNTRTKQDKTYHLLISFPENENVDNSTLKKIEQRLVDKLGFNEHQRISIIHRDTDNLHIHVAINKIHPKTKNCISPRGDFKLLQEERRKCEIDYNLRKTDLNQNKKNIQKPPEFEHIDSIESLISYARKNVQFSLATADSWQNLHQELFNKGLIIKERGNGMILSTVNNSLSIKLSSVDRNFTKKKLIDRLGNFEAINKSKIKETKVKTEYKKKPTDNRKEANELYEQYLEQRKNLYDERKNIFATITENKNKELAQYWESYNFRKSMLSPFQRNFLVKLSLKMLYRNRNISINNINEKYKQQKQDCYHKYTVGSWVEFLQTEAKKENKVALDILRKRNSKSTPDLDKTNSIQYENSSFDDTTLKRKIDTITKHGTIFINGKDDRIKIKKDIVTVGNNPSLKAINECLEISIEKFGTENLNLHGSVDYKAAVLYLASKKGLELSFNDKKINEIYKKLLDHEKGKLDDGRERHNVRADEYIRTTGDIDESRINRRKSRLESESIQRGDSSSSARPARRITGNNYSGKNNTSQTTNYEGLQISRIADYRKNKSRSLSAKEFSMFLLHKGNLERIKQRLRMLLQSNVYGKLYQQKKVGDKNNMRWSIPGIALENQKAQLSRKNNIQAKHKKI